MADKQHHQHLDSTHSPLSISPRDHIFESLSRKDVPFIRRDDPTWKTYAQTYNQRLYYEPLVIVIPETAQHISDAVVCASDHGIKVQAKCGGHSYASFSNGGADGAMVVHMCNFRSVSVDQVTGIAKVGGGTRLGPLGLAVWEQGRRALAHGTCSAVGIGGHYTHGGYGHFSRVWGLAMDQIVALDVVLADGSLVHADAAHYADIFDAMRGAADMIGVAVNFYLQTKPAPAKIVRWELDLASIAPVVNVDKAVDAFIHFQELAQDTALIEAGISFGLILGPGPWYHVAGVYIGSEENFKSEMQSKILNGLDHLLQLKSKELNWIDALKNLAGDDLTVAATYNEQSNFYAKSVAIPEPGATRENIRDYMSFIATDGQNQDFGWYAIMDLYGGVGSKINSKGSSAIYRDRGSMWVVQCQAFVERDEPFPQKGITFLIALNKTLVSELSTIGAYLPYVDSEYDRKTAQHMYYGEALLARLQAIKGRVDPRNVFSNPHSVQSD